MTNRRTFIKQVSAAGMLAGVPQVLLSQQKSTEKMIWAYLIHLSYNMWEDHVPQEYKDRNFVCNTCQDARLWAHGYRPYLTFDDTVWDNLLIEMSNAGMNMVVMDLGDGVQYESHPEISVQNAWTTTKLRNELAKMRKMGLEPIPKLNFATTHDIWLGEYSRMVSTKPYYKVCGDLIEEVISLFDKPRFFHLGMDEEVAAYQSGQDYVCVRQNDLWWGDLYFFIGEVEKNGVRPWVWSDYVWHHPDLFLKKMPKSVLQSNWYYDTKFGPDVDMVKYYNELEKYGYDQIPTGSNHSSPDNFGLTVDYCKKVIDPSRLFGFMTAPWRPTLAPCADRHKEAIDQVTSSIKKYFR
jgi:hypothetical protein